MCAMRAAKGREIRSSMTVDVAPSVSDRNAAAEAALRSRLCSLALTSLCLPDDAHMVCKRGGSCP